MQRLLHKENETFIPPGYNTFIQEIKNPSLEYRNFNSDYSFVLIDGYELLLNNSIDSIFIVIDEIFSDLLIFANYCKNLVIGTIDCFAYNQIYKNNLFFDKVSLYWNEKVNHITNNNSSFYSFDLKNLILSYGRNEAYSLQTWYTMSCKYSFNFMRNLTQEVQRFVEKMQLVPKKCIILDLDNTLWGGVVGETGPKNVDLSNDGLGRSFKDFQTIIKDIKSSGAILAINSKNNEKDALDVFALNKNMILKINDFVEKKINWRPKDENFLSILEFLNINQDAVVFVDDSKFERELIKKAFPGANVPDFPDQPYEMLEFGEMLYDKFFWKAKITEEDTKKTEAYLANHKRENLKKHTSNIEQFLTKLNMKTSIWVPGKDDLARVSQLTMKTNQFNLTTKRRSIIEMESIIESESHFVFVFSSEDIFGDNGKIGLAVIKKCNEKLVIDTFLLSCRVMGRKIEHLVLAFLENYFLDQGYKIMKAYYLKTQRNQPCKQFYIECGYNLICEKGDMTFYEKELVIKNDLHKFYGSINMTGKGK